MNRFVKFRILLLVIVATGLALALVANAVSRSSLIKPIWRYVSKDEPQDLVVSVSQEASSLVQGSPTPDVAATAAHTGGYLIDGGDVLDFETPTPRPSPTPILRKVAADTVEKQTDESQSGPGITVNTAPQSQPTLSPEQQMLGGLMSSRGSAGLVPPTRRPLDDELPWVGGQARGYAMLYALQPEARAVTETNITGLLAARIREPYIGVLVDGTFTTEFEYLREVIRRLNVEGRNLTLALYLANGPAQRRRILPIRGPFPNLSPEEFRQRIRRDEVGIRTQYRQIMANARLLFEFNLEVNPDARNVAVVMLEDNLDRDSYRAALQLVREQLQGVATIVRNPCPGCYPGNDDDTLGAPRETHNVDAFAALSAGDAFTLDGTGFAFPREVSPEPKAISPERVISLLEGAYAKKLLYFGLWRHPWQGVKEGVPNQPPNERTYVPSTAEELDFEIQALRAGLPLLSSSDEEQESVLLD